MQIECFPTTARPPELVPGRPNRAWMDSFTARHPYRCLPLTMANSTGWEILCPMAFSAEWNGGPRAEDITLSPDRPHPDFHDFVKSHFTMGVITFHPGYLFRTQKGWDMLCGGPPNWIKDGLQPLQGLVETDWLPFPFTMNWKFTRPGRIRFEKGEPFCFISLTPHNALDDVQPIQRSFASTPTSRSSTMRGANSGLPSTTASVGATQKPSARLGSGSISAANSPTTRAPRPPNISASGG